MTQLTQHHETHAHRFEARVLELFEWENSTPESGPGNRAGKQPAKPRASSAKQTVKAAGATASNEIQGSQTEKGDEQQEKEEAKEKEEAEAEAEEEEEEEEGEEGEEREDPKPPSTQPAATEEKDEEEVRKFHAFIHCSCFYTLICNDMS